MKTLSCPSCGAGHTLHNPGIHTLVCSYCRTTVYLEGDVARAGERSVVAEPQSSLAIGKTGTVQGRTLSLVGRVQFDHGAGRWDEWYAVDAKGGTWWLSEDERKYKLERPVTGLALPHALSLGARIGLQGQTFEIDETGTATCVGGEGQLPRAFVVGAVYDYADATQVGAAAVLTLERAPDGEVEAFHGRAIPASEVDFGEADGGAVPLDFTAGVAIQCSACGAGFEAPPQEEVVTAVCTSCGTHLQLTPTGTKALGKNPRSWSFPFAVGAAATLDGARFEVVGRLVHDEGWGEITREYLLWSHSEGYRWLEEYEGNYVLMRPTQIGPSKGIIDTSLPRSRVDIAGTQWTCFERGSSTLAYVDGALPWLARVGQSSRYVDFIAPPRMYSVEIGDRELERFIGDHLDSEAVYGAFGQPERHVAPSSVGAASPPILTGPLKAAMWVGWAFVALNLALVGATAGAGTEVLSARLVPADVAAGEWTSDPFVVPEGTDVMGLRVRTELDNGWVALDTELLDADTDEVVGASSAEIAYYHGVEGGESWSEGSRKKSKFFRAPPPGAYQLGVSIEGDQATSIDVQVTIGARLTRYPLLMLLLSLLVPGALAVRSTLHERQRWGLDDDDD